MGNFYTNFTLRGPSQQAVATALAGRSAIVTPAQDGCVVVFDEECEEQNGEVIAELASKLSGQLDCPVLAVLNHDDDILWYQLYLNGGLTDEYNSTPGYFETHDEEKAMSGPTGGDAAQLCAAFGGAAVAEVESILRKAGLDEDGYAFAVERHGDLVGALGIPSFSVGFGFRAVSSGELPEGLDDGELIRSGDLAVAQSAEESATKPEAGYYKVSFRAHPKLTKSIPTGWMPNTWAELECMEQVLSEAFRNAAAAHREKFKQLGFDELGFKKLARVLNPNNRETGGINFLDNSRRHFGQLIYNRSYVSNIKSEKGTMVIAFTAVFPDEVFSCTNHVEYLESVPSHNVIRLTSDDAGFIYEQFISHLKQRTASPRQFSDLASLQAWFDANAWEIFKYRVRRGAWVKMSHYEVEMARRELK